MDNYEKIRGITHCWQENSFGTLTEDEKEDLNSTHITEEAALECFERDNWWFADPIRTPFVDEHSVKKWNLYMYQVPPYFLLFDSLDGETQIIREMTFINPDRRCLRESQRVIYNPSSGKWKSLRMPRNDMNPYKVIHPFYDTPMDYIRYSLGGYSNLFSGLCLANTFFYFRKLVPGIKKEDILKRDITRVYEYGEGLKRESYRGKFNQHIWMSPGTTRSLVTGNSLFEILWDLGYENKLYTGTSADTDLDLGFLENHKRSFLISRRHGVDFGDRKTMSLWKDTIRLLEDFEKDIRNPKYIASELKKTHDLLVDRANRKLMEERRHQEREYRIYQERKALKDKERILEENQRYKESKKKYLGWQVEEEEIKIIPIQSVTDCIETGIELSNCCYSARYYERENSLLLKIYVSGVLTELAEIGVPDKCIYQCHGRWNEDSPHHDRILGFLREKIKDLPN